MNKSTFLERIKFYSVLRLSIKIISNLTLPVYFSSTKKNIKYRLSTSSKKNDRIIVSLTSFPPRIKRVWLVIESILRQTNKPDKIILWLSREQFNSLGVLPKKLLSLQDRGLEIKLREGDLRSHKKYYYTMKEYPNDICLTIDDDVIYGSHLIANLVKCSKSFPNKICCTYSCKISYEDKKLLPYSQWPIANEYFIPTLDHLPIGVGGVLYPAGVLHKSVLNKDIFMLYCPDADDLWLKTMSLLNNVCIVDTKVNSLYLPVVNFRNKNFHHTYQIR